MFTSLTSAFTLAATAANGMLVGASLDQSLKQLPARHEIGVVQYSHYSRAADLRNGVWYYGGLGIGAASLTIAAAVIAYLQEPHTRRTHRLYVAAGLAILHSLATTQAAPTDFKQRAIAETDVTALAQTFDQFERWQTLRAGLQLLNLGVVVWALAESL